MQRHPGLWIRCNQDTINNGKRGTRKQCLTLARQALQRGQSCIIDRCLSS